MMRYLTPLEIPDEVFHRLSSEAQIELLFQQMAQILREEREAADVVAPPGAALLAGVPRPPLSRWMRRRRQN